MADENLPLEDPAPEMGQPDEQETDESGQWQTVAGPPDPEEKQDDADEQQTEETPTEEAQPNRDEFFQTKYQALVETVKQTDPALFQQFQQQWKGSEQEQVQPEETPPQDGEYDELSAMEQRLAQKIDRAIQQTNEMHRQQQLQHQFQAEYANAVNARQRFINETGLTEDQIKAIEHDVGEFYIDTNQIGGPTRYVKLFARFAKDHILRGQHQLQGIKVQSEAEQKALAAKLTMQPSGASPPLTEEKKKQTREEKALEVMQNVTKSKAEEEVFG